MVAEVGSRRGRWRELLLCGACLLGAPAAALASTTEVNGAFTVSGPLTTNLGLDPFANLTIEPAGILNGDVGPGPNLTYTYRVQVTNGGVINGNVDLRGTGSPYSNSQNTFIAQPGSILNGNLILGVANDFLETTLANSGPGQYAGVTGTVTSNNQDSLEYLVGADASTTLATPTTFGIVTYNLSNNAKLTITGNNPNLSDLIFSGSGSVDLSSDLGNIDARSAITLISRGAITGGASKGQSVLIGSQSNYTNAGTIVFRNLTPAVPTEFNPNPIPPAAVFVELNDNQTDAATVTNAGVIKLQTADGVQTVPSQLTSTLTVVNSGVIEEYAGASGSRGIVYADFITNTGQISVGGVGVLLGPGDLQTHLAALTNSGSITSLADTAVDSETGANSGIFASSVAIVNQAGGSITGAVYGVEVRQGGTVANAGQISGGQGSVNFLSGGTLILETGSSLVGDATGAGSNALVLQGAGSVGVDFTGFSSLSAQAQGVWTLSGVSSFLTTDVASGTLVLAGPVTSAFKIDSGATLQASVATLQAQGAIANNGTLVFDQASDAASGDTIQGSGALVKSGAGALTLSGTSSQASTEVKAGSLIVTGALTSGFTVDSGATLRGSTANLLAQGAVANNGTLAFDQPSDAAFGNAIQGSGALVKFGAGSLTLSGTSSQGSTEVAGGALIVTGALTSGFTVDPGASLQGSSASLLAQGSLADNGALTFAQSADGAFASDILGSGSLTKQGAGLLALNGVSAVASTRVAAGTLQVGDSAHPGASLSGPILVDSGATLSGHGSVGPVTNNGTVQPGGSIGVLAAQSYTQSAGGALLIQADPAHNAELVVHGPASLAGALQVLFTPGIYRKGTTFEFIDASGGISGGFSSISANNGVGLTVSIQGGAAVADIVQGAVPLAAGASANQIAVATGFANYPAGVSDFDPVANAVIALPPGPVQNAAFDQLGGEVYADLLTVGRDSARAFLGGMSEALDTEVPEGPAGGPAVWGRAFGSFGHTSADGDAHGMSDTAEGLIVGVEKDLGADAVLGASAAYRHTSLSLKGLAQSGSLDDAAAGLYAERRWSSLFVRGAVGADYQSQHGDRALDLPGISRSATGGAGGYALDGLVEAGARLKAGAVTVQPSVTLLYNRIHQDGFTETGAEGADLAVAPGSLGAARTLAGAQVSRGLPAGGGVLTLEVRAAWAHEFDDVTPRRAESFAAAPGTDFILAGARQNANAAVVGVGLSFTRGKTLEVFTRYDGDIGHRSSTHAVSLGARLSW